MSFKKIITRESTHVENKTIFCSSSVYSQLGRTNSTQIQFHG